MLERQNRLLYLASLAKQQDLPTNSWASQLGVAPFVATKLKNWQPKWQPSQLRQALHALYQLDGQIKTSQIPAELGVEQWIIQSLRD
jgi:DNA polymerase III delta subunit